MSEPEEMTRRWSIIFTVLKFVTAGLAATMIMGVMLGLVMFIGLNTSQANRIIVLSAAAVFSSLIIIIFYLRPFKGGCFPLEDGIVEDEVAEDLPPAYEDVINTEPPPPPYYSVVTEQHTPAYTLYTSPPKICPQVAARDVPSFRKWLGRVGNGVITPQAYRRGILRLPTLSPALRRARTPRPVHPSELINHRTSISKSPSTPDLARLQYLSPNSIPIARLMDHRPSISKSTSTPDLDTLSHLADDSVLQRQSASFLDHRPSISLISKSPSTPDLDLSQSPETLIRFRKSSSTPALSDLQGNSVECPQIFMALESPNASTTSSLTNISPYTSPAASPIVGPRPYRPTFTSPPLEVTERNMELPKSPLGTHRVASSTNEMAGNYMAGACYHPDRVMNGRVVDERGACVPLFTVERSTYRGEHRGRVRGSGHKVRGTTSLPSISNESEFRLSHAAYYTLYM